MSRLLSVYGSDTEVIQLQIIFVQNRIEQAKWGLFATSCIIREWESWCEIY